MNDFIIGLITTVAVIIVTETVRFIEKRLIGTLTLVGIAFIYIGFCWSHLPSLVYSILAVALFFGLAALGYSRNFILVIAGLVLHGVWDILFPFISSAAPDGYGLFCLTVDLLLAVYFYIRVRPLKRQAAVMHHNQK